MMCNDSASIKREAKELFEELASLDDQQIEIIATAPRERELGRMVLEFYGTVRDCLIYVRRQGAKICGAIIFALGVLPFMEVGQCILFPDAPSITAECHRMLRDVSRNTQQMVADISGTVLVPTSQPEKLIAFNKSWHDHTPTEQDLTISRRDFSATDASTLAQYDLIPATGVSEAIISSTSPSHISTTSIKLTDPDANPEGRSG